jgi:hypothetical protein
MLGIHDPWILAAYLTCVLSAVLCIIYGAYNWNRGGENEEVEIKEENKWQKDEIDVESSL